jgi:hypothetical protein
MRKRRRTRLPFDFSLHESAGKFIDRQSGFGPHPILAEQGKLREVRISAETPVRKHTQNGSDEWEWVH